MDITLKDVKTFLEENKDEKDTVKYLEGLKGKVDLDTVKDAVKNDKEVEKWLLSEKDSAVTKGIEGWKEKSLPGEIKSAEEKLRLELSPQETEDQKKVRELLESHTTLKSELAKEKMLAVAKDKLSELGLSHSLAKHFVGETEESTIENINSLGTEYNEGIKTAVEKEFKANGRVIHKDESKPAFTEAEILGMTDAEVVKNYDKIIAQ